ncbi:MAG: 3-hydroxyacyl-CoA dehydrogenase family protein [Candidatus Latescibacteria bacterium]|jgi:3-hydroxybutyryl-CoA dehydrogenase|nr:3-hydroxyacyl-CoA dehydrogenase family protein [Candidatus Latescibacterota bacterium]
MENSVAVIGAGLMGAGIAGEFARGGYDVALVDTHEAALEKGLQSIQHAQQTLVDVGHVSEESAAAALGRLQRTTNLAEACAGVEVLVEAVPENLAIKQEMYAKFDQLCLPDTILASNTSGLSISKIASATTRPEKVVGLHFWNPPHVVPLVEVTKGEGTLDATAEYMMDVCKKLGKKPILVQHDIPGFVGNRLQYAVVREALHLVAEGVASPEDVDLAMTAGPGLRYGLLGPLRTADLGGLDVFCAISEYLCADLNADVGASPVLKDLVEQGKLGAKTGEGFYSYSGDELNDFLARRDRVLLGFLDVLKREAGDE